ncbi:MAG: hypothetical protein LBV28_00015 [Puniceicoccales bacterium]|jgi:hypothetical protein|nr:hypothetical protein [Puniceicoccales bacterium]
MRRLIFSLLVLGVFAAGVVPAAAQSRSTRRWKYIEVDDGSGNVKRTSLDEAALAKQREERRREYEQSVPSDGKLPPKKSPWTLDKDDAESAASVPSVPSANAKATAPDAPRDLSITLEDGRKLPFGIGQRKVVGGNDKKSDAEGVDPYGGLRNWTKMNDSVATMRYEGSVWQGRERAELNGENRSAVSLGEWHSRFNAWGGRETAPIDLKDSFDAERRDKTLLERKKYGRDLSPWAGGGTADFRNRDTRRGTDLNEHFPVMGDERFRNRFLLRDKFKQSLSMQDINRYQFRRAHSPEPGMPAATPGGTVRPNAAAPNSQ